METNTIENHRGKIFSAISNFVKELNSTFGKKYKPVALYCRLIEKTDHNDIKSIDRHINAFKNFFKQNIAYIKTKEINESFKRIVYSQNVYLDINVILNKTDVDSHKIIHQHLFVIYTLLNLGTKQGLEALEQLKAEQQTQEDEKLDLNLPDTVEGNFIKETLAEMTDQFKDLDTSNPNPMAAVMGMVQNGFFGKFMNNLQTKFSNGEMDIKSLLTTVMSATDEIAPSDGSGNELKNMMKQSMEKISNVDFSENPSSEQLPDISNLMSMMGSMTGGMGGGQGNAQGMENLMSMMGSMTGNVSGNVSGKEEAKISEITEED